MVAIVVSLLLALSMTPAFNVQSALADEPAERPATTGGDVPLEGPAENTGLPAEGENQPVAATVREDGALIAEGLVYKSEDNGAVLAGFEDGASLDREIAVPERLTDGVFGYTVKGVDVAEGQTAPNVLSLVLPQTVEDMDTKSLATAMPALARVSVDGRGGAYSSANGMLFRQESIQASSDGSTTRIANRELVWAPPAMVIARVPGTCKAVASGAFTDDKALETVMVFSIVDSVAKTEKDDKGNVTKEGAFTDEQVSRVNIVTPMETLVYPEGDRISTDAFLAEDAPLNEKHIPWCDCGFEMDRFTVGIPYGSTSLAVAVPEDGRVGTPEITIGHYTDHPEWDPKGDTGEPQSGLVFEYKADMTVSVTWKGDKAAVPSHLELPAYVVENGVKTAVTEVAPNAFEGATQLESVVVPEGVTVIGEFAFAGCSNLKDASLPSTLMVVDNVAFDGCGIGDSVAADNLENLDSDAALSGETLLDQSTETSTPSNSSSIAAYGVFETNFANPAPYLEFTINPGIDRVDMSKSINFNSGHEVTNEIHFVYAPGKAPINNISYMRAGNGAAEIGIVYSSASGLEQCTIVVFPVSGWKVAAVSYVGVARVNLTLIPEKAFSADSHIDRNVADLANYYDKTAADGRYALEGHNHDLLYAKLDEFNSLKTKVDSKADKSLLSKSGEAAFTATDTVRGAIKSVSSVADAAKKEADANKAGISGLGTRVTALENKKGLELGDTATTAARGNHNHDGTYAKQGDFTALSNTVGGKANSSDVYTKEDADDKFAPKGDYVTDADVSGMATQEWVGAQGFVKSDAKNLANYTTTADLRAGYVAKSEFGSISYEGMEGVASKAVMPTAYRAGGTPSLHEPERDGYEFAGWSWSRTNADGSQESGDGTNLAEAFSAAGRVTLTAEWERAVPEANHFFTPDAPLRAGDASEFQTSVIKVRLSDAAGRLERAGFSRDDATGLLKEGASVELRVGDAPDVMETGTRLDLVVSGEGSAAVSTPDGWSLELAELGPDSWGVYVGVRVRTADVAESPVASFTEGSYVASLVKMSYRFA